MSRLALVLLLWLSFGPRCLAQDRFRITGVVLNSITKNPIGRCHLEASLTQNQRRIGFGRPAPSGPRRLGTTPANANITADTDERGRFSLTLPSAGAWHLTASATGYVTQPYDAHGMYSSAVVLTDTAPAFQLQFPLPPEGRISGSIVDEAGEAVRNAMIRLIAVPLSSPSIGTPVLGVPQARAIVQTDDLGRYEFDGLPAGEYRISVEARPWYATGAWQRQGNTPQASSTSASLPLDVTYAPTWYPGVDDSSRAQSITLQPGDDRKADLQLNPIPAIHLQVIVPPAPPVEPGGRTMPYFPVVERVDPAGQRGGLQTQYSSRGPDGSVDIGGLAPGTYRISLQGPDRSAQSVVMELTGTSAHVVDFREASSEGATVAVHFDNDAEGFQQMFVQLVERGTGQVHLPQPEGMRGASNGLRGPTQAGRPPNREMSFAIPPGRYELLTFPRNTTYVTGITSVGAKVDGRMLDVPNGESTVTIHTAEGRAALTGVVKMSDKPCAGAVVLLVPAGLDDTRSFTNLERDQSNTDGSFDLNNIVPGDYILIAVDHGWQINWSDPQTLNRYLAHGIPMTIGHGQKLQQNIEAQSP